MDQTHSNWECWVVDDGSTDNTKEMVAKWCDLDPRFKWLERPKERKKGANACRNLGIESSTGNYIMFLDSDDTIATTCFENRCKHFEANDSVDGLIFSTQEMSETGLGPIVNKDPEVENTLNYLTMFLSYKIPWQISSPIWRREALTSENRFDEAMMRFQDVDFHTQLLLSGCQVKRIHEADFYYHTEDAHDKFHDETFIAKALVAIRYYIAKYDKGRKVGILQAKERRIYLRKMYLNAMRRFVHGCNRPQQFKSFVRMAWRTRIFSRRECLYLSLLRRVDKYQLQDKAGFGFYRLNKFLLSRIFPSN